MGFSKSRYTGIWQCPKIEWLKQNKPEEYFDDPNKKARFDSGHEVGEKAKHLFGDYVDVTTLKDEDHLDYATMVQKTQLELTKGTEVICEASFLYKSLFCSVNILKKDNDGYSKR